MLQKFLLLLISSFFLNFNAQSKPDLILGDWMATDNSVLVRVFKEGHDYNAKVLWFDKNLGSGKPIHERRDHANPDPKLRNRKIIGMEILHGLHYNAKNNSWEHGKIYDGSSGRTWDSSVTVENDGTLKVRGYWKFKWIGKTMSFKKYKP